MSPTYCIPSSRSSFEHMWPVRGGTVKTTKKIARFCPAVFLPFKSRQANYAGGFRRSSCVPAYERDAGSQLSCLNVCNIYPYLELREENCCADYLDYNTHAHAPHERQSPRCRGIVPVRRLFTVSLSSSKNHGAI